VDIVTPAGVLSILTVRDPDTLLEAVTPEAFPQDERLPYWAQIWSSSVVLARELAVRRLPPGSRVFELGCGLGLAGISAARAGAQVMMTDYDEDALAFAGYNALTNAPDAVRCGVLTLLKFDWRDTPPCTGFDLVLGADIVYEHRNFVPILHTLERLLHPEGVALFTDPDRSVGRTFLARAASLGFDLTTRSTIIPDRGRDVTVVIAELRKRRGR
jgi:predicted nicotinamide N-methyase